MGTPRLVDHDYRESQTLSEVGVGWTFTRKVVIHPKLMARARVTENSNPVVTILQDWNDPARVGRGESDHTIDWYDILAGMTRYYKRSNVCGDPPCVGFQ